MKFLSKKKHKSTIISNSTIDKLRNAMQITRTGNNCGKIGKQCNGSKLETKHSISIGRATTTPMPCAVVKHRTCVGTIRKCGAEQRRLRYRTDTFAIDRSIRTKLLIVNGPDYRINYRLPLERQCFIRAFHSTLSYS